jgi:3-hydroxyisobutyrate dehydrogenase-like beta-hydroxyacid dehydrogenase
MQAAFVGLGVMGYPMAGHLQRGGHAVTVFNRTRTKADRWVTEFGGAAAETPRDAAAAADVVLTCVGNDDDLRSVVLGDDGVLAGLRPGGTIVDHTTASATVARELAAAAAPRGVAVLDAPVSGGQSGAENGQLSIMVGGEAADLERVRPLLAAYGRAITHMGETGAGQLTKMVNQICLGGLVEALAEALAFAQVAGLDAATVLAAISRGAAQSWMMDHRAATMFEDRFDFGFAVDWMRKDLAICLDQARRQGSTLPATALVDQLLGEVQRTGGGRLDITSLIRLRR